MRKCREAIQECDEVATSITLLIGGGCPEGAGDGTRMRKCREAIQESGGAATTQALLIGGGCPEGAGDGTRMRKRRVATPFKSDV